jgi:signal transduction histidine kinase
MHVLTGGRRIHAAAWSLAGLTLVVLAATLVFVALNSGEMTGGRILFYAAAALAVIGYAVIGGLIARRVAGNVIGWLLCLIGLTVAASMFSEQYSLFGLATSPGSVPAVKDVGALAGGLTVLAVIQLVVLVLVFPDGHLLSRRWRPVLWGMCLALAGGAAQQFQSGTIVQGGMSNALAAAGVAYREPVRALLPRHGWFSALLAVVAVVAIASVVLTITSVFARRRRGTAEVRQQLAWLAYAGALTVFWIAMLPLEGLILGTGDTVAGTVIWGLMILTPVAGIPVACAVAVLRYRLYDLDVVVKKTVVAGLVAAAFTAIYALVVVGIGAATGGSDKSVLTFAAAAIAAVVLQPARARARLVADRLVYGKRATPYEVLSDFAGQIAGTYSTQDVLPSMARMVAEATGAERAEVWLRTDGIERLEAAWPGVPLGSGTDATPDRAPWPSGTESADGRGRTRSFPVVHRGEEMGTLRVTSSLREPLTPAGERMVRDVAAQAGLVLRNVGLIEDLRASRQRIVTAADEARRGIERNLHDGAQQQLVALKITLGLARQVAASSPDEIDSLLADTERQAEQALVELRDLAHGIYPPLLADMGLRAALEAQARKAAVPVSVEAPALARYSQDVEAALYFSVLEALQNVAKYAAASTAKVTLYHDGEELAFTVADDGHGFDQTTTRMGSGVQGICDRIAALGGTVQITSAPGQGTRLHGRVPATAS